MKIQKFFLVLISVLAISIGCGSTGKLESYSAVQVRIDKNGRETNIAKLYVSKDNVRMDMTDTDKSGRMSVIFRTDLKKLWMVLPETKAYFETELTDSDIDRKLNRVPQDAKVENLGEETVNGFKCKKQRITTTSTIAGKTITHTSIVWTSGQIDFPLRRQDSNGTITELRNISEGPQAQELFEIPEGYQKSANLFDAMGMTRTKRSNRGNRKNSSSKKGKYHLPKGIKLPFGK